MRRVLPVAIGVLVVIGGIGGLLLIFSARDAADLDAHQTSGPGVYETASPAGKPPTSGEHRTVNVTEEGALDDDRLLTALAQGNVVIVHDSERPPAALTRLQEELAGPFDAELAAAGQSVILARGTGAAIEALAWQRRLELSDPADPALREFAEAWIGKGAPR